MYCHRVPEFPLDREGELFAAVSSRVARADALSLPEVQDFFSVLTSVRRDIHAHPEPGFEETRTHAALRKLLTSLAHVPEAAIRTVARTGLVVDIKGTGAPRGGSHKVRTVAIRADMDALRMTEKNTALPYRSTHQGVAHLCGHDGHMASLIGCAVLVQRKAAQIPSDLTVRLLFQPAEEGPGGAQPMIAEGCMLGVDEVYGYHNWPSVPLGHMWVTEGPIMGHPSEFSIKIKGRGGHGSQPQAAVDPVLVAAHVVIALQTIVSRSVHPREQVRRRARPRPAHTRALSPSPPLAPSALRPGGGERHDRAWRRGGQRDPGRGDAHRHDARPERGRVRADRGADAHARLVHLRGVWRDL